MPITVFSKPGCVQCNATYRALDKKGIEYNVISIAEDPSALSLVVSKGKQQMPVVVVDVDGDWNDENNCWTGFHDDKIESLVSSN